MPTIRTDDLREQARRLAGTVEDPDRLTRALLDLLESFKERTRRSTETTRAIDAVPAFEVPPLVLSHVRAEIEAALVAIPSSRLPVVRSLWDVPYREPRLLALGLIQGAGWDHSVAFVEEAAKGLPDRSLLRAFAGEALAGWKAVSTPERLEPMARWLRGRAPELRLLALEAIDQQVETADLNDFPSYFALMAGLASHRDRSLANGLRNVLKRMARRSPAETAQFLLDEFRGNNRRMPYRKLASDLLDHFPEAQRSQLQQALRA